MYCNVIWISIHSLNYFFQILVERDDVSWDTREWLNVYKDNYQLLAVEHKLVLANRSGGRDQGNLWPALVSHILAYLWQIFVKKVHFLQVWISLFFVILLSTQNNGGWRNCLQNISSIIVLRIIFIWFKKCNPTKKVDLLGQG